MGDYNADAEDLVGEARTNVLFDSETYVDALCAASEQDVKDSIREAAAKMGY